ncbi:MAG TPA: hydrogenase expression/formation protein HypE [Bacteroidota bacterium]|nr:hydrogenase expression/formation protein HypE [Bacteroidota bacterium]
MTENKKQSDGIDFAMGLACPIPISDYPQIMMAHGGGGKLSQQIVQKMIVPQFRNELLNPLHDGAVFPLGGSTFAFSTDSYVINPIFFPGGSIGELAVNGTVNDLAMCGARPMYLSAAFIIEEGLAMNDLWKIIVSMQSAAEKAGVQLVTGDTKVVDRGKGDKIFINTSGVGLVAPGVEIGSRNARPGDVIVVSGEIAVHGIAIMSVRAGLEFQTSMQSDTAALNHLVAAMLETGGHIHVLRDPTRGGVASTLNEIAESSGVGIRIDESKIPISDPVRGACEILGLDPLYVANEGKLVAFVDPHDADLILGVMRDHPLGKSAAIVGEVVEEHRGTVVMQTMIGGSRVVDMLSGEQLPRIC